MSDTLGLATNIITLGGVALTSCKNLKETIKDFNDAPNILMDLRNNVEGIQGLLQSLEGKLDAHGPFSDTDQTCLVHLRSAIEFCKRDCGTFTTKLRQMKSYNAPDSMKGSERVRIHLQKGDMEVCNAVLERDKQTLDIAIGMTTLQSIQDNKLKLEAMETKIMMYLSEITGQMEGLRIAMSCLASSMSSLSPEDFQNAVDILQQQDNTLKDFLKVCKDELGVITKLNGTEVKYAEAFERASVFVGNMGYEGTVVVQAPPVKLERLHAHDEAKAASGNMSSDVAKSFWG